MAHEFTMYEPGQPFPGTVGRTVESSTEAWPSRHPGVVLDAVPHIDHPACLGCQWFDGGSGSALQRARAHETSEGAAR